MEGCVNTAKMPDLLEHIEEVNKAMETIKHTTGNIYEWLRVRSDRLGCAEEEVPMHQPPTLIDERAQYLQAIRQNLYELNSQLEEILATVREI